MDFDWGQGAQGAIGGAESGAAFGGWGAGIGGVVGGLLGALGGDPKEKYRQQLDDYVKRMMNLGPAPQAAQSQFRTGQMGLISQLQAMARGEGPSAAAMQMREAMNRATAAQASVAASAGGRGINSGAALRMAANNTAAIQAQGARDTALARVNEQLGATQQLGGVLSGARGQDEALNQFNVDAQLRQLGITNGAQLAALMAAMGVQPNPMGASLFAGGATAFPTSLQHWQGGSGMPNPNDPSKYWQGSTRTGSGYNG